MTEEPSDPPRRRRRSREGEAWDGGEWVDVGSDDKWTPTFAERSRALILLLVLGGILFLAAAVASLDDGDGDGDTDAATTGTSTTTAAPTSSTTTTVVLDPASLDGEAPPTDCVDDEAREAAPLRDRARSTLLVLNGSYRSGHANDTNDDLEDLGYTSMQPANADDVLDETLIEYLPGYCAESVRLFLDLGLSTASVAAFEDGGRDVFLGRANIVVTMGRDSTDGG